MNYVEQTETAGRHIFPDLVRCFALIGIAVINVGIIAYPLMGAYNHGGFIDAIDDIAYFTVNALFFMKSYTLFAFMFGVGFAYQMHSAERLDASFSARYYRRILGLFLLGLLNIGLFFQGDILVLYAILGSVLFLFRNATSKTLVRWGIGFYVFQILVFSGVTLFVYLGQQYAPEDMAAEAASMADAVNRSQTVYGDGGFAKAVALRFSEWSEIISIGIMMEGMGAFAFFLFGLAAVRADIISSTEAPIWRKFRRTFLPIGLIGSAIAAYIMSLGGEMMDPVQMFGTGMIALFSLFSSAGYLGLIAKWASGRMTSFKTFMARGGTATLTAYLLQGLMLSLIFNNYGLGYFGELGAATCIAIALAVALLSIAFTSLWRQKFARGPFEYGLRWFTYLGNR